MTRPRRWLRRTLVLVVSFAVVLIVARWFFIDLARVSSPSMAPLLLGSSTGGDQVLFLKRAFAPKQWPRYGLAVYRTADEVQGVSHPVPTIKRVVGLPFDTMELRHGDLFLEKPDDKGNPKMQIEKKPHDLFDDLLVPVAVLESGSGHNAGFFWNQQCGTLQAHGLTMDGGGETPALLSFSRDALPLPPREERSDRRVPPDQVTDGYLDGDDVFHDGHVPPIPVSDLRFQIDLLVEDDHGEIELTLRDAGDIYRLRLAGANGRGSTRITKNGEEMEVQPGPLALERGRRYEIDFYNIDSNVGFYLDGRRIAINDEKGDSRVSGDERNAPELAVRGMRVQVLRARLSRDLYWLSEGRHATSERLSLGDQYFMLGDNSAESIDSRTTPPIASDDLVGRPIAILFPWHRWRRL